MKDVEKQVVKNTADIKSIKKDVNDLKAYIPSINKAFTEIEKQSLIQTQLLQEIKDIKTEQKEQEKRLDEVEKAPGKEAKDRQNKIVIAVLSAIATGLVGAVLALILK